MILIALAMFVVSGLYVYSLATHSHAAAERFVTKYQAIDQSKFRKTH
ncbi:MAG: hypothetical protein JWO84_419 [Parcubacteria group bacterium]|nr:hypothetical protein [Parcubacteria group bacterium]